MTEEVKQDEVLDAPEIKEADAPQLSALEQEVVEQGWLPKDKFIEAGHAEDEWVSAREFKKNGELMARIEALGKELKQTRSSLGALKGHYEKVKETEFKHALETLKAQKKQALDNGDSDAVIELDDKIAEVRETQKEQAKAEVVVPEVNPEFTKWTTKETWYGRDTELTTYADRMGRAFAVANPGIDPTEVLSYVSDVVKNKFPAKFKNAARSAPNAVEAGNTPARKTQGSFELNADEERAMNRFVRDGLTTKEKYIEEIKKIRGVK